jgi:hypothetical protein
MIKLGAHEKWTKSSHSGGNGACVEVKSVRPTTVDVQDSKHEAGISPVLSVSPAAFAALIASVRS